MFLVQLLNGVGDLIDLMKAVDPSSRPNFSKMTPKEVSKYVSSQGHCSALVKVFRNRLEFCCFAFTVFSVCRFADGPTLPRKCWILNFALWISSNFFHR